MKKIVLILLLVFPIINSFAHNIEKGVHISKLSVGIDIVGAIAFTSYDIELYNPNDRQMEYELILPLSPHETVVDYKLNIGAKLRSGVVVNKDKARQTFESIVRRGVDPGVIEKVAGNNYKLRVYPIMRKGYRRTVIITQQRLQLTDDQYIYSLLANAQEKYPKFNLEMRIHDVSKKPSIKESSPLVKVK